MGRLIPAGTGLQKYMMRIPKTKPKAEERRDRD